MTKLLVKIFITGNHVHCTVCAHTSYMWCPSHFLASKTNIPMEKNDSKILTNDVG